MAGFYHLSVKIGSRSKGTSAVAAAAYRSGTKMTNLKTGENADYTRKTGVVHSEILLPQYAPSEYYNREVLWNSVEKVEKRKDSQLFREFVVAFPRELTYEQQIDTIRQFAEHRVNEGMCVDFSIHHPDSKNHNPHAHMMCTLREILPDGSWSPKVEKEYIYEKDQNGNRIPEIDEQTGKQKINHDGNLEWKRVPDIDLKTGKQRTIGTEKRWKQKIIKHYGWDSSNYIENWRKDWADVCNKFLDEEHNIDWRSFDRQNIDRIPTIHEGYVARKIEEHGGVSERCELNREIRSANHEIDDIKQEIQKQISTLTHQIQEAFYELRHRIAKIQEYFARSLHDAEESTGNSRLDESAARRNRETEGEEQRASESVTTAERQQKEVNLKEPENIFEIQKRRESIYERLKRLIKRRENDGSAGETTGRNRSIQEADSGRMSKEQEFIKDNIGSKDRNKFFKNEQSRENEHLIRGNTRRGADDTGINGETEDFGEDSPRFL